MMKIEKKKKRKVMKTPKKRMYRGIPVREARASLLVQPSKEDIKSATREDPSNCAYANCIKRTMGTANVFVFKTIAYIEVLDENGNRFMERYLVKTYARNYITRFDSGAVVNPGGFVFHKPNRSLTLVEKQKVYARMKERGTMSPRVSEGKPTKVKQYMLGRSGKGKVHLLGTEDQIKSTRLLE